MGLQDVLTSSPVLLLPDYGKPFTLYTDAMLRSWPHFSFLFGLPPCYVISITLSLVLTTFCLPRLWTIYKPRTVVLGLDYLCFVLGPVS